MKNDVILIQAH